MLVGLVLFTAAKFYFAAHAELFPEEAYYWSYLQHPALGYFDHPPMVAWVAGIGTSILGDTELGVRLGFILLSLGSTLLVFLLTRLWYGARVALWAAALFNLVPIFIGIGVLAFPDGPLVFFWLLTLYAVSKAIGIRSPDDADQEPAHRGSALFWLLAGVAFGGALLSKYTAVMLGASLGLFLMVSPTHRHWLRRFQPWLAGFVALAVFAPVLVWNAQHEWASFLFQSTRTVGQRSSWLRTVTEFWLFQLVIIGPLLAVFGMIAGRGVRRGWFQRDDRAIFAVAFSLPLFLVFVFASFKTEVHINWTAPCFLSLLPAATALLHERMTDKLPSAARWRRFGWALPGFALCAMALGFSLILWGVPAAFLSSRAGGWREIAARVSAQEAELARRTGQDAFVVGADKYNLSALIGFYSRAPREQVNNLAFGKHGLGFRYWTDLKSFEGRPAVVVETRLNAGSLRDLTNHFERVDAPQRVSIPTFRNQTRSVWLVNGYGYQATPKTRPEAAIDPSRAR